MTNQVVEGKMGAAEQIDSVSSPRLLFINHETIDDRIIVVFAAYFDLSTRETSPVVSMTGYASTVAKWVAFTRLWNQTINKAGISCFHMTDWVARAKPPFNNPDEAARGRLMRRLVSLINAHVEASFSVSMLKTDYEELFAEFPEYKASFRSPWQYLAMINITAVRQWALANQKPTPIPIIFDRGDEYSAEFKAQFDHYFIHKPILVGTVWDKEWGLGSITFDSRCNAIPLQAADMLAWETWRHQSYELTKPSGEARRSYKRLINGCSLRYGKFVDRADIVRTIENLNKREGK